MLHIKSEDENEKGSYTVGLTVKLLDYPDAQVYSDYFSIEILTAAGDNSVVAWVLLPIFIIIFFILGGILGIMYQKRKSGQLVSKT